jgi:hypothetical protein
MEPLPKIVRERLQADTVAEHPDPDLLTAFAETTLGLSERSHVVQHLAGCAECRHIIALAADLKPGTASPTPSASVVPRRRLLSWPVLRWGALAACIVIVSAVGLLVSRRSLEGPKEVAGTRATEKQEVAIATRSLDQPARPAAPNEASEPQTKKETSSAEADVSARLNLPGRVEGRKQYLTLSDEKTAKKEAGLAASVPGIEEKSGAKALQAPAAPGAAHADRAPAPPAATPAPEAAGQIANAAASPAPEQQKALGQSIASQEQQEAAPMAKESVEVTAAAPALQTENASVVAKRARSKLKNGASANRAALGDTAQDQLAATAATANSNRLMLDVNAATWTLSADGVPQRSFNSGKTWEKVRVDGHTGFRALSSHGMDIWVGGLAGILYHSSDLGMHWTRVIPVANEGTLTADILTIDFRDAQHGKLTTANRETWTTADSGKTWQKE